MTMGWWLKPVGKTDACEPTGRLGGTAHSGRQGVRRTEEDQEDLGGRREDQLGQLLELFSEGSIGP